MLCTLRIWHHCTFIPVSVLPVVIAGINILTCMKNENHLSLKDHLLYLKLQVFSAILGIGMSSVLATGILWCEMYIIITPKINAAFFISGQSLQTALQATVGYFIVLHPTLLFHMIASTLPLCIVLFIIGRIIGKKILSDKNETRALLSNHTDEQSHSIAGLL